MIVDGKPVVMGSHTVMDGNGYSIMTMYVADKDGYKPITKVKYQPLTKRKDIKSLIGK